MQTSRPILLLAIVQLAAGCATYHPQPWTTPGPARQHVLAFDPQGYSIDPDHPGNFDNKLTETAFDDALSELTTEMDRWTAEHSADGVRKVVIFVHGGLNEPLEALDGSLRHARDMMGEDYYPICIVWNSGLKSSYGEHLAKVRQGRYSPGQWWGAPFFVIADVGKAIARAPIVWGRMFAHDYHRSRSEWASVFDEKPAAIYDANPQLASTFWATNALVDDYDNGTGGNAIPVSMGKIHGKESPLKLLFFGGSIVVSGSVSWLLDSTGTASWDNMYRRAMMIFDGPSANAIDNGDEATAKRLARYQGPGAMQKLIDALAKRAPHRDDENATTVPTTAPAGDGKRWQITIVGHSMGAIVLNEFVSRSNAVDLDNIVYMAAACTVREAHAAVLPYLETHRHAQFYNLSLHPVNDLREVQVAGIPPRGSLLVWIDDMFANPATTLDRTFGRWDNVVQTAFAIRPTIRPRVHLKAFDLYVAADRPNAIPDVPQMHGDFSSCKFWRPTFWQTLSATDAKAIVRPLAAQLTQMKQLKQLKQVQKK